MMLYLSVDTEYDLGLARVINVEDYIAIFKTVFPKKSNLKIGVDVCIIDSYTEIFPVLLLPLIQDGFALADYNKTIPTSIDYENGDILFIYAQEQNTILIVEKENNYAYLNKIDNIIVTSPALQGNPTDIYKIIEDIHSKYSTGVAIGLVKIEGTLWRALLDEGYDIEFHKDVTSTRKIEQIAEDCKLLEGSAKESIVLHKNVVLTLSIGSKYFEAKKERGQQLSLFDMLS